MSVGQETRDVLHPPPAAPSASTPISGTGALRLHVLLVLVHLRPISALVPSGHLQEGGGHGAHLQEGGGDGAEGR